MQKKFEAGDLVLYNGKFLCIVIYSIHNGMYYKTWLIKETRFSYDYCYFLNKIEGEL